MIGSAAPGMEYDCRRCGACCTSPWTGDGYARVYDPDVERLRGKGLPLVRYTQAGSDPPEEIVKLATKLDAGGRRVCAALSGLAGEACSCGIYEDRPQACRRFEVGGALCREARQRIGLPV